MFRTPLLSVAVLITLSGCARLSESRMNPFNWFGNSREVTEASTPQDVRPLVNQSNRTITVDGRELLHSVTELRIERSATGAIVRATGIAPTQGYYNAELVNAGVSNGVLTLEFRAQAPSSFEAQGNTRTRQISAAYIIDSADLSGIRSVRVQAQTNARTSGR
ncbi:hypothetical protein Q4555_13015 [Octadecabacter sp. 1_MG-2023]|uniref:hypothetical protein n=1 Tax=unclassified Octadecabacter TaxID=196158 RepID=UPI001C0A26F8|nr:MULTISPECIES: hypothetical protein [unclassified Octadecabacter]MBU2993564.1 hypothetical protein [Octadecabacter sp. B2R22]MDO6735592.1 hypothetical protein [Octadecabacter sp. 1_MG-2023]